MSNHILKLGTALKKAITSIGDYFDNAAQDPIVREGLENELSRDSGFSVGPRVRDIKSNKLER